MDPALQILVEELQVKTPIYLKQDPRALICFEYGLNITLKEHQAVGIRDMTQLSEVRRFRSVLLAAHPRGRKLFVSGIQWHC